MAVQPLHIDLYGATMTDISAATNDGFVVMSDGTLEKVSIRASATVTGTAIVTVAKNGTAVDTISMVAPDAGDVVSWAGAASVAEGDYISFTSNGGSTTASIGKVGARIRKLTS